MNSIENISLYKKIISNLPIGNIGTTIPWIILLIIVTFIIVI